MRGRELLRMSLRPAGNGVMPIVRAWRRRLKYARLARQLDCTGQAAHDLIRGHIESSRPFMACRFGWNELNAVLLYGRLVNGYHKGQVYKPEDYEKLFRSLSFQAGFFPLSPSEIARFYHRMMGDMSEIDVLGSWITGELDLAAQLKGIVRVKIHDLDPVLAQPVRPWTGALRGKRVLVVHPFDRSIKAQYAKRTLLFSNPEILPDFELITLRAVQNPSWSFTVGETGGSSTSGVDEEFKTWFDGLSHMERQIEDVEFDVALIGCGAYGLPLAAHVKRLGLQAVHLGGMTQMLFGIKGDRWMKAYAFSGHNEHWVYPLPEETPAESGSIEEGGTYWRAGS
jgi:hypothetical protein